MSTDDRALVGRTIAGKFLIESFLGGGAMGKVYRARHLALEKAVAVKVMHRELASDGMFAARFHREAKAASRLDHPNSIRVIDFGEEPDGLLYIAMELVEGRDLFHLIQEEWPFTPARIVDILVQALAAIAVAHDMNVVHRDLKPENIMVLRGKDDEGLDTDVVKVCDFGIAKITDARGDEASKGKPGAKLTTQGLVVGTPEYMSPEQGRGESLDARSDLYSVGVILYQMLTGRVPFEAESAIGIVLKHVSEAPVPPTQLRTSADPRLEAICLKAMQKKREDRYQSAREMRAELRALVDAAGAAFARAKTEPFVSSFPPRAVSSSGPAAPDAQKGQTQEIGTAATVAALDSGAVEQAVLHKTQSKVTPAGTEAFGASQAPGAKSGRGMLLGMLAVAMAAGVAVTLYATRRHDAAPVAVASAMITPPVTTLESIAKTPVNAVAPPITSAAPPPPVAPLAVLEEAKSPAKNAKPEKHPPHTVASAPAQPVASIAEPPLPAAAPAASTASPPIAAPASSPSTPPPPPAATPVATPAATPSPAPAPEAPAAPFTPERAFIVMHGIETTQGLPASKVRVGLQRVHPAMNRCYQAALVTRGSAATGRAVLRIAIDDTGRVTAATLGDAGFLPGVGSCIESSVRSLRFQDADTGEATATVHLEFKSQ